MEKEIVLEIRDVSKSFSGVRVLSDIAFSLEKGVVHAVVGENGAGKSTLIKILSGAYKRDSGEVKVRGKSIDELTPRIAHNLGIVTIYQERNLLPNLSVAENILLGDVPVNRVGVIQWKTLYNRAGEILDRLNLPLNPKTLVNRLSSADQQAVEIAKALYRNVNIVIMDEPTASLTKMEIDNLFDLIRKLKKGGVSTIYISHRLDEIFEIADFVTVLRDGVKVMETDTGSIAKGHLVKAMVGEELSFTTLESAGTGEILFRTEGLGRTGHFEDISLDLHYGEILGIAGMVGSGRTSLVRTLAGIDPADRGRILFENEEILGKSLAEFIDKGICFIPEDRDSSGLILRMNVAGNTSLASLKRISRGFLLDLGKEREEAEHYVRALDIAANSVNQEVETLSGGNRQKVMLAKWLCHGLKLFIMDEPTQGVDVGAREEIHRIMKDLTGEGKGIIMVSSDLDELLNMSSRVAVMNKGKIITILNARNTTREEILSYAIGE